MLATSFNLLLLSFLYLHLELTLHIFVSRSWLPSQARKFSWGLYKKDLAVFVPHTTFYLVYTFIILWVARLEPTCDNFSTSLYPGMVIYFFLLALLVQIIQLFNKNGWQATPFVSYSLWNTLFIWISFSYIQSYIVLFFFLEVYAILYYFYFLKLHQAAKLGAVVQVKQLFLFYLWNNFLTNIFFGMGLSFLGLYTGNFDFFSLNELPLESQRCGLFFITLSLFWKLGLPTAHFFKIEIYKYLTIEQILFFSMISLVINTQIIIYIYTISSFKIFLSVYSLGVVPVVLFYFILPQFFQVWSFYRFLALSSVVTLLTLFIILI